MKVAEEEVPLDVSLIATKFRCELCPSYVPGSLLFLITCGTGRQSESYEPPGFPDKWIANQRALAVVASLCPIPDYFAHTFVLKFYDILMWCYRISKKSLEAHNQYIAKVHLETRRYFTEIDSNPLGLAYALCSVEGARIEIDLLRTGGIS
jgi:hypothetical protein